MEVAETIAELVEPVVENEAEGALYALPIVNVDLEQEGN